MRAPWFRKSNSFWYIQTPDGKQHPLGKDPHGATRKSPPADIVERWHQIERKLGEPKERLLGDCVEEYLKSLTDCPKESQRMTRWHVTKFLEAVGNVKAQSLQPKDITAYLA